MISLRNTESIRKILCSLSNDSASTFMILCHHFFSKGASDERNYSLQFAEVSSTSSPNKYTHLFHQLNFVIVNVILLYSKFLAHIITFVVCGVLFNFFCLMNK